MTTCETCRFPGPNGCKEYGLCLEGKVKHPAAEQPPETRREEKKKPRWRSK